MSLQSHLEALELRHAALDERILSEQQRPSANILEVKDLKRQKLKLKDQIVGLRRSNSTTETH